MEENFQTKQKMFSAPFSFKGRIRRLEYCLSRIIAKVLLCLVSVLLMTVQELLDLKSSEFFAWFMLLITCIPYLWFLWAQGVKRCHDRGNSGWYMFVPFYLLWMCLGDGEEYENDYGPDPKGRDLFADVYEKDEDK